MHEAPTFQLRGAVRQTAQPQNVYRYPARFTDHRVIIWKRSNQPITKRPRYPTVIVRWPVAVSGVPTLNALDPFKVAPERAPV